MVDESEHIRGRARRRAVRLALIGVLTGAIAVFAGQTAIAAITNTARATVVTVPGNCYQARAQINTNLSTPTAYGFGWAMTPGCASATNVPAGYMQVQALSLRNGVTCANVFSGYNAASVSNMSVGAQRDCGTGSYTGRAAVFAYRTDTGYYADGYTALTPAAAF